MTRTTRALSSLTLVFGIALPVLAQSGANRTGPIPVPSPASRVPIVESADMRECRLHRGSLAATPNNKTLPNAAISQLRREACEKKMLHKR
jgi:hypothetical protein